jgi:hypothetical protein
MATMVIQEDNILASSDPSAGAINVSSNGDRFEIQLQDALQIPPEAINVQIVIEEATVWWTVPNIIAGENDKMYITCLNVADALTAYVITIPQGLYDLAGLNQAIIRELSNAGAKIDPSPAVLLSADDATQKVEITLNYLGSQIDFTPLDTPRDILGFDSQVIGATVIAPYTQVADNVAGFNTVNYFLIHSDLTNKGIRFNNRYNQTVAQVLITASPGSQIVSTPFNPARINAQELAGAKRTNIRFWITDDKDRPINTNGEFFTCRVVIKYLIPHIMVG